jgi:hypothetical protein
MKRAIGKFIGGVGLLFTTATLGSASTIAYYTQIFYPGNSSPSFSPCCTSTTALTATQLTTAADGAPLTSTTANGFTTFVVLPKFDQTIVGDILHQNVLDSVQIAVGWASLGAVDVTNTNTTPQGFTDATSTVPLAFSGPAGLSLSVAAAAGPYSGSVGGKTTTPSFLVQDYSPLGALGPSFCTGNGGTYNAGNQTCSFPSGTTTVNGTTEVGGLVKSFGTASSSVLTTGLNNYEGLGLANLSFTVVGSMGQYGGSSVPGVSFGGSASAGGVTEIIYTYHTEAIPEPVTMSLVGGALLGLAVYTRRRARR